MTQNQLAYWKQEEEKRSNLAQEAQANRTQRWREYVDFHTLREQRRTHIANEGIAERQQVANDQHYQRADAEQARHNLISEQIQERANQLQQQSIVLGYHQADVSRLNAQQAAAASRYAASLNYAIGQANVAETYRSNVARQAEINRSNLVNESFTSSRVQNEVAGTNIKAETLGFEQAKWNDSVVTAQRKANLLQTQVKSKDIAENMVDRRVSTITSGVRNLGSVLQSFLPRGGYSYK